MFQIDQPSAVSSLPVPAAPGTPGYFTDGDPALGEQATIVPAEFLNMLMLEDLHVLAMAGIAASKTDNTQLYQAIIRIIEARVGDYSLDTGVANSYVIALNPPVTTSVGVTDVKFRAVHANTGICTLDVGFGPIPLRRDDGTPLQSGDLPASVLVSATYDSVANIFLINSLVSSQAMTTAQFQSGAAITATAAGTANALTAAFVPVISAAANQTLLVRALLANTTTTPTIDVGFGALTFVKGNNLALSVGDIAGAGHWLEITLDATLGKAVLQNPATGVAAASSSSKIQPLATPTVVSNALTVGVNPTTLDFRAPSLASGAINTRILSAAVSLTIPAGASLGAINAQPADFAEILMDNAGTLEPAVINLASGVNLDETTLISSTAISGASTSSGVFYSATARTNLPFRLIGIYRNTQAVAGTYATLPSLVQGVGGQALAAMSSLGYGQKPLDVTASRSNGVTYYNIYGKPFPISATSDAPGGASTTSASIAVGGVTVVTQLMFGQVAGVQTGRMGVSTIVPIEAPYSITCSPSIASVIETR